MGNGFDMRRALCKKAIDKFWKKGKATIPFFFHGREVCSMSVDGAN